MIIIDHTIFLKMGNWYCSKSKTSKKELLFLFGIEIEEDPENNDFLYSIKFKTYLDEQKAKHLFGVK